MAVHPRSFIFTTFAVTMTLLLTALPVSAYAPPRGWTLGSVVTGFWGEADEIVQAPPTHGPNQNQYMSLLRWDIKPAVFVGLESRWESGKDHGLDLALHLGIPSIPTGEMHDFDWFYTDRDWSHWSVSDTVLAGGVILDVGYDWTVVRAGLFSMSLGMGYHLDWWSWRDRNKDSLYSQPGSNVIRPFSPSLGDGFRDVPDPIPTGVNGINYDVAYNVPLVKIGMDMEFNPFFIDLRFRLGPVLAFSHDHHRLRDNDNNSDGLHFYDTGFGGLWVDMALDIGFQTSGGFSLRLRGEYARLDEFFGTTKVVYTNGDPPSSPFDGAGFAFWRASVGLMASWSLGSSG